MTQTNTDARVLEREEIEAVSGADHMPEGAVGTDAFGRFVDERGNVIREGCIQ
jgi:hypothetical protein